MAKAKTLAGKNPEELIEKAYKDHFDHLYAYALIITKSKSLAKDTVSEVFFNLLKSKADLGSIRDLKSYLFTCIKNQANKVLTYDPYNYNKEAILSIDRINPEELLIGKELDQFLQKIFADLPPQCGLVFKMVKENQMKYHEVATELHISVDTVKYHLKTAVRIIKLKLEDHFEDTKVIRWFSSGTIVLIFLKMILVLS
jgi:RNA polymerase sigma-70 factor (ECF subfamily)